MCQAACLGPFLQATLHAGFYPFNFHSYWLFLHASTVFIGKILLLWTLVPSNRNSPSTSISQPFVGTSLLHPFTCLCSPHPAGPPPWAVSSLAVSMHYLDTAGAQRSSSPDLSLVLQAHILASLPGCSKSDSDSRVQLNPVTPLWVLCLVCGTDKHLVLKPEICNPSNLDPTSYFPSSNQLPSNSQIHLILRTYLTPRSLNSLLITSHWLESSSSASRGVYLTWHSDQVPLPIDTLPGSWILWSNIPSLFTHSKNLYQGPTFRQALCQHWVYTGKQGRHSDVKLNETQSHPWVALPHTQSNLSGHPCLCQPAPPKDHFLSFSELMPFTGFPTYLDDYYGLPNSAAFSAPLESFPSHPTIILFTFTCPSSVPPASVSPLQLHLLHGVVFSFPPTPYTHTHTHTYKLLKWWLFFSPIPNNVWHIVNIW